MQAADYKQCPTCQTSKPLEEFHRDRHRKDGRTASCRTCRNGWARKWNAARSRERAALKRSRKTEESARAARDAVGRARRISPLFAQWLAGFTDGEGTFHLRMEYPKIGPNAGRQAVALHFSVCQHSRDRQVLEHIQSRLGFGRIDSQSGGRLASWRAIRQADLEVIVRLFGVHQLLTAKREDFAIWRQAVPLKRRLYSGGGGAGNANAATWRELTELAERMSDLRGSRRG